MALLEKIESMAQSGMTDVEIVRALKEEGISPRQINEALSQSKIKAAVAPETGEFAGMQPSIMAAQQEDQAQAMQVPGSQAAAAPAAAYQASQAYQAPAPAYYPPEAYAAPAPEAGYAYPQDQAAYPAEEYAAPEAAYYSQVLDVETVRDIAKQEIEEALKKIREQLTISEKTKTDLKFELQNMENRLMKIESIIQEVQSSIIKKMGQYGEAISGISGEVKATQQSFSKMLGPLMDKRKISSAGREETEEEEPMPRAQRPKKASAIKSQQPQQRPSSQKASAASFEDYLR